jgi:hypothetical protein
MNAAAIDATDVLADLRFARDVEALHKLGARVLFQYLVELGQERLLRTDLEIRTRRWTRLNPEAIKITGADQPPARPMWIVPRQ